jgi:hypothetical protein
MVDLPESRWPDDVPTVRDLDRTCDRFEAAWRASSPAARPDLNDFLPPPAVPDWAAYFRELLRLDRAYRLRRPDSDGCGLPCTLPGLRRRHRRRIRRVGVVPRAPRARRPFGSMPRKPGQRADGPRTCLGMKWRRSSAGVAWESSSWPGRPRSNGSSPEVAADRLLATEERRRFRPRPRRSPGSTTPASSRSRHGRIPPGLGTPAPYLAMEYCPGGTLARGWPGTPQSPARGRGPDRGVGPCGPRAHRAGVSTATSSRPTSCSTSTGGPRSPTSAWRRCWTVSTGRPKPGCCWARRATCLPSRLRATPARRPAGGCLRAGPHPLRGSHP